ncbi:hypothetical protein V2G26_005584 [Clonostachys chloroleuca]
MTIDEQRQDGAKPARRSAEAYSVIVPVAISYWPLFRGQSSSLPTAGRVMAWMVGWSTSRLLAQLYLLWIKFPKAGLTALG